MSQLSIGELKAQLLKRGVDISTCLERQDLEAKLKETNDDKTGDVVVDRCDVCDGEDGELLLCDGGMLQGKVQCNYAAHPACVGVDLKDLAEEEDWLCVRCVAAKKKRLKGGHEASPKKSPKKPPADGKRPRKAPVAEEEEEEEDHVEEEDESDDYDEDAQPQKKAKKAKKAPPKPKQPAKKEKPKKAEPSPAAARPAQGATGEAAPEDRAAELDWKVVKKRVSAIVQSSNLEELSARQVRETLGAELGVDFSQHKKQLKKLVEAAVDKLSR
jgi:hypothetical protein